MESAQKPLGYTPDDPPSFAEILRCTHCGLCLNQCPTYRVLGWEMDSPRGRIYLMRGVAEGRFEIDATFALHMDVCLACRACQTACPASIDFGKMVEAARGQAHQALPQSRRERLLRRWVFGGIFPRNDRLRLVARLIALYQRSGMQALARRLRLIPRGLRDSERLLPRLPWRFTQLGQTTPAQGVMRGRVALLAGCVMGTVYAPVNEATIRVLTRNGFEVVVPPAQICCGALATHAGERAIAKEMAKRNIEAFAGSPAQPRDAILVNAAGCGLAMKEYGDLLKNDAGWQERAAAFAAQVQDVSEFLVARGIEPPPRAMPRRVTYQDPCHLAHGQGVRAQPRQLLAAIPGLQFVEMRDPDRCCGSAGIYNITHPDIAAQVLDAKMETIAATQPEIIVTANAGCMLQLQAGVQRAGLKAEVLHLVELLDRAYQA
ncbi:MAG: (Fe-S)-binding protein [Chloroflexi bacterium]|nr:(Fe-S)-binding protein [Chloroflexota bacterium]